MDNSEKMEKKGENEEEQKEEEKEKGGQDDEWEEDGHQQQVSGTDVYQPQSLERDPEVGTLSVPISQMIELRYREPKWLPGSQSQENGDPSLFEPKF